MVLKKNEVHPLPSITSLDSHLKKNIVIQTEDIRGVDDLYAFFLAFLAFLCLLTIDGTSYTTGLLTERIQTHFNISSLPLTLLPGSMVTGIYHIVAPFEDALSAGKNRLRSKAAVGALIAGIASLTSAFLKNYFAFIIFSGIIMGVGLGLIFIPCIALISSWFVKYKSYGICFAYSGTGFGIFIFSQFFPFTPKGFQFEGHYIGISILCFLCAGASLFFKKSDKYLEETLYEKKKESRMDIIKKLDFEEKLRKENKIIKTMLIDKNRKKSISNCFFDGMVLTVNNDLIPVTTSTAALYDEPRLTKEQIDHITEVVMQKLQEEKKSVHEAIPHDYEDIVRDYIQSKIVINNPGESASLEITNMEENNFTMYGKEKELVMCSIRREIDKISIQRVTEVAQTEEITKIESFQSGSPVQSIISINNTEFGKEMIAEATKESNNFSQSLWKSPTFLLIIFGSIIAGLELVTPYSFIPLFLRAHGINETDSSTVISLMGLTNIMGRILAEIYVQKLAGRISYDDCLWFHNGGLLVASLSILCSVFVFNYYRLFVFLCCLHSTSMIFSNSIQITMVLDYLGSYALTTSYTYILVTQGIFMIAGPPLHGFLLEKTKGDFTIVFLTIGGLIALSAVVSCFIRLTSYLENCTIKCSDDVEYGDENHKQ